MIFETKDRDLLGRIGKLTTKSSVLETPLLFPVINPSKQLLTPAELKRLYGLKGLINRKKNTQD